MEKSLYELRLEFWKRTYEHWVSQEFLSFQWFLLIAMLLTFYVVWIKLVDKKRLRELLLFGSFIAVSANFIDIVAVTSVIWTYKVRVFPISPAPFPFDYTVIPIMYMLVKQYTSSWRNYIIGSLLASSVFSFIIEPIYISLGLKQMHKFNYFYMFLLVFIVTTIIKFIFDWVTNIERKNSTSTIK